MKLFYKNNQNIIIVDFFKKKTKKKTNLSNIFGLVKTYFKILGFAITKIRYNKFRYHLLSFLILSVL